ncbi:MAG: MFS transporter [Tepidisphaeraceae bacterium]
MNELNTIVRNRPTIGPRYKWAIVAMLWFVCFFNYADRMAIYSVFPLLKKEMLLSDVQLGILGSEFMWVYAAMSPIAGWVGDRVSRKTLIVGGLIFWSVITLATALSTDYLHLVIFRAAEGLGEAFYFPAAMSLVSDYHGRATRSKAMAICQSSVYAGTIAGGTVAGFLAEQHGWRSSFYLFGALGVLLGSVLVVLLKEPQRGEADAIDLVDGRDNPGPEPLLVGHAISSERVSIPATIAAVFENPIVLILVAVFICANFVASVFLTWMPSFLHRKFDMSLAMSGLNATGWLQIASAIGVMCGGVLGDALATRTTGGRMMTQAVGLFFGIPFIFFTGYTLSTTVLVLAMVGFGFFKGFYDANLWASLYDVVPVKNRGTALGIMNALGWVGGGIAPVVIAAGAERYGMSTCLSATSGVYLVAAVMMIIGMQSLARRGLNQPKAIGVLEPEGFLR